MQLSQKQKTFSQFFAAFSKSRFNFDHSEKKDDPHTFFISEITESENMVRKMSKRSRFRKPFGKQHGKHAKAVLKSVSQHLDHIHRSLPKATEFEKVSLIGT